MGNYNENKHGFQFGVSSFVNECEIKVNTSVSRSCHSDNNSTYIFGHITLSVRLSFSVLSFFVYEIKVIHCPCDLSVVDRSAD